MRDVVACGMVRTLTNALALPTCSQIDFLEHPSVRDVVVCGVVLEETQHKNSAAYQRLRALCAGGGGGGGGGGGADEGAAKRFYVFSNEHHK